MILFKTALRNSKKYFRRSLVIAICIAISTIAMQSMDSIGEGFKQSALKFLLKKEGMILLEPENDEPLDFSIYTIVDYNNIKKIIKEVIPNSDVSGEIFTPAMVIKDSFSIESSILSEEDLRKTALGEQTANVLKAEEGDTLILLGNNRYGGLSIISSIIDTTAINFRSIRNGRGIMLPFFKVRELLAWRKDEVKKAKINFEDYWNADIYAKKLGKTLPEGIRISTWEERLTNLEDIFRITDIKMNIFAAIILIVVAGIIMNTVLTAVLERKKDIGTLRSIGASRRFVVSLIITEILFISLIGSLIGTGISYYLNTLISKTGISISEVTGTIEYLESTMYPVIVWKNWMGNIIFALIWATIWSIYPVVYISRMKPVDALKEI